MSQAAPYTAVRATENGVEIVRLTDAAHQTEVCVAPSLGNNAFRYRIKGKDILWSPYGSIAELRDKPAMLGNPFLGPWANRLDEEGFYANGKHYRLNPDLKNIRKDGHQLPIHGLLLYAPWDIVSVEGDNDSARLVSQIEFWKHPDWMAQFPFAHTIRVTYVLRNGELEVRTELHNLSMDTMPVSIGYHTYYQIPDSHRDEWQAKIAAREHVKLSPLLIPTTERDTVTETVIPELKGRQLDDVYTGLIRDGSGQAEFFLQGGAKKVSVVFGPNYHVAVVYSPSDRQFLCFEPMSGLTNAFNLAAKGEYNELQTIPAGGVWKESFWIKPSGF